MDSLRGSKMKIPTYVGVGSCRIVACVFFASLIVAKPGLVFAQSKQSDLQQIQTQAETLKAQADACAEMKCPVSDCARLTKRMQALIDAETILDAMHEALIEEEAAMRANYNNKYSASHLTGTMLAQLQNSLAWQEFFHKFGSYMIKVESIFNTMSGISEGTFKINTDKGALDVLDRLDSLANLLKNSGDLVTDFIGRFTVGEPPSADARDLLNFTWDLKNEGVDLLKVGADTRKAFLQSGVGGVVKALDGSRNTWTLIARTLKLISEKKLKAEKEILKELQANQGPEAAALTGAFQEWQQVRSRMLAAEEALAAVRQTKGALATCTTKAKCGSSTLSRPRLPVPRVGALRALEPRLLSVSASLKSSIEVEDKCPEPGTTPPPPEKTDKTRPKHVVQNNCPKCSEIALELGRTLDEMDFDVQELRRIRSNIEKAEGLEKDANILRDAIKRISDLIQEFRYGKKDRNELQKAGDALFRTLGKPHREIDIETLERERRERQENLRTLEEKIKALRAEEGQIRSLEKEHMRLYELSESLKAKLAECQKSCAPSADAKLMQCFNEKTEFDHWDLKQKQYPSSSNKTARESAVKRLCVCLKTHPEVMTDDLRRICPNDLNAVWKKSPVWKGGQSGPKDKQLISWNDPSFDDASWETVSLPNRGADNEADDRYYRSHFTWDGTLQVRVHFESDDGLSIYINGKRLGSYGKGWRQVGCVNEGCGLFTESQPDASVLPSMLRLGDNVIAVDLWNGAFTPGGYALNIIISQEKSR